MCVRSVSCDTDLSLTNQKVHLHHGQPINRLHAFTICFNYFRAILIFVLFKEAVKFVLLMHVFCLHCCFKQ